MNYIVFLNIIQLLFLKQFALDTFKSLHFDNNFFSPLANSTFVSSWLLKACSFTFF